MLRVAAVALLRLRQTVVAAPTTSLGLTQCTRSLVTLIGLQTRRMMFDSRPTTFSAIAQQSRTGTGAGLSNTRATATTGTFMGTHVRHMTTFGQEYQPSQIVRKRRHGFRHRLKTANGRRILQNRKLKGRKFLSH